MVKVKLSQIKSSATFGGHNHRNPYDVLGLNEVTFAGMLTASDPEKPDDPADTRTVMYNLAFGPEATDESRAEFVKRLRQEVKIWGLSQNMMIPGIGQLDAIKVVAVGKDEYAVVDGERRWLARTLTNILSPSTMDDTINVVLVEGDEDTLNKQAISANSHRKGLNEVEVGRNVKKLKDAGLPYKDAAGILGLFQKAKGANKAPIPNHQYARNCALLHDAKVTDEQRQKIAEGTLSYTKVLKAAGLMKDGSGDGVERDDSQPQKVRKRSKNLKELTAIYTSRKEVEKLVESILKKEIGPKDTFEIVRATLARAMNAKWKLFKDEPVADESGEEDAA